MTMPRHTQEPAAPSVSDAAISAAKNKVGQPANDTLAAVRSFVQRAKALLDAQWQLRQSATQQARILADQQAQAELRSKPISELRDVAGKGARLNTLAEAGFRSVADVAATHPQRLQAVPGIGQRTAHQVAVAAQQLWAQVRAQTRFRFNPDRPAPAETQLLAALAAIPVADSVHVSLEEPLRQFTAQTDPLLVPAERTGHKASMLLRGWKPSTEEQAIARAHRMGQTRKVQVHRLLAKGSVDERLREVQEEKSLLFAEFARKSDAKEADSRSVDASELGRTSFNDESVPTEQRIIMAEQHRLGID